MEPTLLAGKIVEACANGATVSDVVALIMPLSLLGQRLEQINNIIYAKGAPLGTEEYFKIRELATEHLRERRS
jgi:hypothetical protein